MVWIHILSCVFLPFHYKNTLISFIFLPSPILYPSIDSFCNCAVFSLSTRKGIAPYSPKNSKYSFVLSIFATFLGKNIPQYFLCFSFQAFISYPLCFFSILFVTILVVISYPFVSFLYFLIFSTYLYRPPHPSYIYPVLIFLYYARIKYSN